MQLLANAGVHVPHALATRRSARAGLVNLPAVLVVAACTALLVRGTRESARANAAIVALKLGVLLLVIVVGAFHVAPVGLVAVRAGQHGRFGDLGASGILRGAGVLFFAYVGFDAVSTAAAEARDPARTVPRALLGTVAVATLALHRRSAWS